jgi:hypothetical protein
LILHLSISDRLCGLQKAVGKGTLAMVDMSDDAEVADIFHLVN